MLPPMSLQVGTPLWDCAPQHSFWGLFLPSSPKWNKAGKQNDGRGVRRKEGRRKEKFSFDEVRHVSDLWESRELKIKKKRENAKHQDSVVPRVRSIENSRTFSWACGQGSGIRFRHFNSVTLGKLQNEQTKLLVVVRSCAVCPTVPIVCPASSSPGSPWLPFPPGQWRDDCGWNLPRLGLSWEERIHSLSTWLRTSKGLQCGETIYHLVSGFCTWLQTFKMFYCFPLESSPFLCYSFPSYN